MGVPTTVALNYGFETMVVSIYFFADQIVYAVLLNLFRIQRAKLHHPFSHLAINR